MRAYLKSSHFPAVVLTFLVWSSAMLLPHQASWASPPDVKTNILVKSADNTVPAPRRALSASKEIDRPSVPDFQRMYQRRLLTEKLERRPAPTTKAEKQALVADTLKLDATVKTGTDKVLVILVEFGGPDKFLWTPGVSTWDPKGKCDPNEYTGEVGTVGATANIRTMYGLDVPTTFTYTGPLHNAIQRPLSKADRSGEMIWRPDFSNTYYKYLIFGNGTDIIYDRQDGSKVNLSYTGSSVNKYFEDLSGGRYHITGEVIGWLKLPHSSYWYGADPAPGSRSGVTTSNSGGIPGAGNAQTLVTDALNAVKVAYPNFNWKQYDLNDDGLIDRLWIIHSGLGEEDSAELLDRTDYGEGAMWSHSSSIPPYPVYADGATTISASAYIMMPENSGIGVLAHEYSHNLGADDLYAYGMGETSAGFWTLMSDDWTGYPISYLPPSCDPMHLDRWGWLDPTVISDPTKIYTVNIGQASAFPGGTDVVRGAKIVLADGKNPLPIKPMGGHYWWGGKTDLSNGMMVLNSPIAIPASADASLSFNLAYDIEDGWDFLWIQASSDSGAHWVTLTNANTVSYHESTWIGSYYGFPDNLAAAGIGGFTGYNSTWPDMDVQTFDLNAFKGKSIILRFWHMTDWGTTYNGPFVDNVKITSGTSTIFSDDAETANNNWTYTAPWERNDGNQSFTHNYYLQWRNVSSTGGYDRCLGDPRWRFGPANTGLIVWYNNNFYTDNEIGNYLTESPGFGPKGLMLVVDAHPEPYRDPYYVDQGYANEGANLFSRSLMRDAPFSLLNSVDFHMPVGYVYTTSTLFAGFPAVSQFSDSMGYYPGSEYVSRGPGYNPPSHIWITKQWDASVVIPSKTLYGVKAPGYTKNEEFRYYGVRYPEGRLLCYWFGPGVGLGYDGGTGNPKEANGQYGWNVRIVSQTDTGATVKIWNSYYNQTTAKNWENYK